MPTVCPVAIDDLEGLTPTICVTLSETAKGWQTSTEATAKPARTTILTRPRAKLATLAA